MSGEKKKTGRVGAYYDAVAESYHEQYRRDRLYDTGMPYPANYFRLQLLLSAFLQKGIKRVIEVGVGEGTPLSVLAGAGIDIRGFDISDAMVAKCKQTAAKIGIDPALISYGDIQDPATYSQFFEDAPYDGLMALGVMPHVENDDKVLKNMAALVRPGGSVFIEFRNKLFSLFTFNRYTLDFILNDLLETVDEKVKDTLRRELEPRLRMDLPPARNAIEGSEAPGYDAILSKFHNPLAIDALFKRHNFSDLRLHWYHYHPAAPFLNDEMPDLFRQEAIRLEREPSGWKGLFLCSAFVVEAVKSEG